MLDTSAMNTANRLIRVLILSLVLIGMSPVCAQTLVGKWQVQGQQQAFHFSEEGAFAHQFDDQSAAFGIWYLEDAILAIVYVEDESAVGFNVIGMSEETMVLEIMDDGSRMTLNYLGAHEIPDAYVSLVAEHLGGEAGDDGAAGASDDELEATTQKPQAAEHENANADPRSEMAARTSTIRNPAPFFVIDPGNLSLVGCWIDDSGISDPMVFDEHGFYKKGRFEGDYIYEDLGLYQFDGRTLTVHFFKSVMDYNAGDIVPFEITNLTPSALTIDLGGGYRANYSKSDKYQITEANRNEIRAQVNHQGLENTWWDTGREQYLFLAPDLVITRKGSKSDFHKFAFDGNELYLQTIDTNGDYQRFGKVTAWNEETIIFETADGQKTLRSGQGDTGLSADESRYYKNYVIATQNLRMQSLLGIGQGMDIIEVEWKH